jgi:hypothetical protein
METAAGCCRLIDFMPLSDDRWDVVRIVEGVRGSVDLRMELLVRFDYGSIVPWVRRSGDVVLITAGPDTLELATAVKVVGENMKTVAEFTVGSPTIHRTTQPDPSSTLTNRWRPPKRCGKSGRPAAMTRVATTAPSCVHSSP